MGNTVSPRTIIRNGKTAKLYRARKTYECDLPGCTGVILPGQEYYSIFYTGTGTANCMPLGRVHVTDIEQYLRQDRGRSAI